MFTTRHPDLYVQWLIDPVEGKSLVSADNASRNDFPFPPEIGHGWYEYLPLSNGMSLFHGVHRFHPGSSGKLIPLGEFHSVFPETSLVVQTVQGGVICHRESHPQAELIYKPGFDFFRHADRLDMTPSVDSSSDSEMTSLCISGSSLARLLGEGMAQQLVSRLGLGAPPVVKVMAMPLAISAPLRASVSTTLRGQLKLLFAQSKTLEYLCGLAAHVGVTEPTESHASETQGKIRALHAKLMKLQGRLPTLNEMSADFGMSGNWLNREFAREYGQSIYSFVTHHRLSEAHVALVEGDLPIKTLSERLGYSHVNHFTIAFKHKFGYPPGSLRRSRTQEHQASSNFKRWIGDG